MELYPEPIEEIRRREYPQLEGKIYLDHAGTQLPPKSLMETFAKDMIGNLYGNPHSECLPARLSGGAVDYIREQTLKFFGADPQEYDLIFVQNATSAVKLVADCFMDYISDQQALHKQTQVKFWSRVLRPQSTPRATAKPQWTYVYHKDCHTSLVGVRELACQNLCLDSDVSAENWIRNCGSSTQPGVTLLAYPGQSNMTGRRLPTDWLRMLREHKGENQVYTLFDAAALATTKQLQISDWKPDFVSLSFYKIFGFPDLGALLVRKNTVGSILAARKFFGGGTVDMVIVLNGQWHAKKTTSFHDALEEGTLPFHNIIALGHAMDALNRIYGSISNISLSTQRLIRDLYNSLSTLTYAKSQHRLVHIYKEPTTQYGNPDLQGATITFTVFRPDGTPFGFQEIERRADRQNIYIRSGSLCNPGGVATYLGWEATQLRQAYEEGHTCSTPAQIIQGRSTGVVRVSLGACSSRGDVDALLRFLRSEFLDREEMLSRQVAKKRSKSSVRDVRLQAQSRMHRAASSLKWSMPWNSRREACRGDVMAG